jgi:hypothetical protein
MALAVFHATSKSMCGIPYLTKFARKNLRACAEPSADTVELDEKSKPSRAEAGP